MYKRQTKNFQVYSEDHSLSDIFTVIFKAWNTGYEAQATTDTFDVDYINDCKFNQVLETGTNVINDFSYMLTKTAI